MFFNVVSSTAIVMCVCVLRFAVCMSWCCEPAGLFDVQLKLPRASVAPGMHTGVAGAQLPQRKHEEEEDGWATRRADFFASSRAGASRRQWSLCGHHRCAAVCSLSHDSVPGAHGPCSRRILHVRVYSASGMQRPVRFRACDRVSVRILCAFRPGQLLVVVATGLGVVRIATLLVGSDCAATHAVATLGGLIFGAAEARALPLSRTSLDRCVGAHLNGECFSHVARLRREAQA